jgi:HAD superfamily hydrolase (TIGR01509 family)
LSEALPEMAGAVPALRHSRYAANGPGLPGRVRASTDAMHEIDPRDFDAVLAGLDGVVTDTARVHASAWKKLFDEYLRRRAAERGEQFVPFDEDNDYRRYVDGKPRYDGVASFLESRAISLPRGTPEDRLDAETVCGLGNRENRYFLALLEKEGVPVHSSSVSKLREAKQRGLRLAVVSSSGNCRSMLEAAALADLFSASVDGAEIARLELQGKPEPDMFLEAARRLDATPGRAVVIENATAGVRAASSGRFGLVIGVDRGGQAESLRENGADVVVADLSELRFADPAPGAREGGLPDSGRGDGIADPTSEREGPCPAVDPDDTPAPQGGWSLVYDGFVPDQEGLRESLCTLGNGHFATRGAAAESVADDLHYPATYLAGGYNRLPTEIAGRVIENEDLVNFPNWVLLTFRIEDGSWFDLRAVEIRSYRQELDLRNGILLRALLFRDAAGHETSVRERRLVHLEKEHLGAVEMTVTAENWSGRLSVRSALDGRVANRGVRRYRDLSSQHLEPLEARESGNDAIFLKVQTNQSQIRVAQAARTRVYRSDEPQEARRQVVLEPEFVAHQLELVVSERLPVTIEKIASLYSSRDRAVAEPGLEARKAVAQAERFEDLARSQAQAWRTLWEKVDLGLQWRKPDDLEEVELTLRLHIFHLMQTASVNSMDLDVGIPARGLTGEAYRGHVFWDDLFVFPFLDLRISEITRALLKYRYRRLGEARDAARAEGYRGAMFPWQSGSNGREESQTSHLNPRSGRWIPDNSRRQRHVNAAIVYNIWHYYQVTGDMEFLCFYGAEMLIEIARFWASIATFNQEIQRYEILGVMGPDEYHDGYPGREPAGLNNNAYTNVMASWVLCRALETLDRLPEDWRGHLCAKLNLRPEEIHHWEDVSRRLRVVFHGDGIISQFEGYEDLEDFDWEKYRAKYDDIQRLDRILEAEGDTPNRYKASKQADVLMLFYLFSADELRGIFARLGYQFDAEMIPRNVNYYIQRTSHGSTLSRVVHSWVLARLDREQSWVLFTEALKSDLADIQGGTTPEGIHLGAMAGTVDLVQRCYTGIDVRGDVLWFNPCLPRALTLRFRIRYRGHTLDVEMTPERLTVTALRCTAHPIEIGVNDTVFELSSCQRMEFPL